MDEFATLRGWAHRWRIPLFLGGVVGLSALLAVVYFVWFHQPYAVLFKDLRTMDAATIVAELDKRKVPYQLKDGGRAILVPQKLVDSTRLAVMSEELPLKGVVGFELFNKSDMGLTEFAQRINYRRALQGEIARTIMAMDAVDSARVHLSLSDPSVFRDDRRPSKASVSVIPRAGRRLSPQSVRGVQRLVAAAVPDLEAADVVVLDEAGAVVSSMDIGPSAASAVTMTPAVQERSAIEGYYAGRVRLALRALLPDDQVAVTVTAGWGGQGDTPATLQGDPFANWSPETRRFPLGVNVAARASAGPQLLEELKSAAARAIDFRAAAGDAVSVTYAAPISPVSAEMIAPEPTVAAQMPARAAKREAPEATPSLTWIVGSVVSIAGLLAVAVVLTRRGAAPRRLTVRQRAAVAGRLRKLLDEGDAHAVPRG